ncbi:CLUMA_CG002873, isoform A [Clunio marinus]|uniref:CLUMA_CG002873, isoform A n=1 Tax=Clunio marinus TaxID=568069 RepID=A0A1J1HMN6_9DIPT|nr:CLUMA_CG002873, isoform A [Clunio marinus]
MKVVHIVGNKDIADYPLELKHSQVKHLLKTIESRMRTMYLSKEQCLQLGEKCLKIISHPLK